MSTYLFRSILSVAACLISVAQPAEAKPRPPTSEQTFAGQSVFLSVVASPEFVDATRSGDWEAAKELMDRQGIRPHPNFPTSALVCPPGTYVYYAWQWVLGSSGYYLAWLPKGCKGTVKWEGNFFPHHE